MIVPRRLLRGTLISLLVLNNGWACKESVSIVPPPIASFPSDLDHRVVLRGALTNPEDANDYVGYLLTIYGSADAQGQCKVDTSRAPTVGSRSYLKSGVATPPTLSMSRVWYQSIVSDSARVALEYLGSSSSAARAQLIEILIEDIARAEVNNSDINYTALGQVATSPLPGGVCQRLIILRTYLTSVKNRFFNKAGANVAVGYLAVKADGAFYTASEQLSTNLLLALDARDIDELKVNPTPDSLRSLKLRIPRRLPRMPVIRVSH